jgi:hypothetical protein
LNQSDAQIKCGRAAPRLVSTANIVLHRVSKSRVSDRFSTAPTVEADPAFSATGVLKSAAP